MQKLKNIIKRREFYLAIIIIMVLVVYILFFKPNPILRIDTNKLLAAKSESALSLEAPEEVEGVGQKFVVRVNLDTMGNSVNAVQSYLEFDSKILEIVTADTAKSFCKFYPENSFDNSKGLVKLSCGAPYPGFRGKTIMQEIEFTAKAIKTTTIRISQDSMVLANDGKGTDLLRTFPEASIRIKASL